MTFRVWFLFFVTEFVLSVTPGLAVLYTISQGLRGGIRNAAISACGILSANAFYFALSATSLGAILAASTTLFQVIKYTGAAYLVYLGLSALLARSGTLLTKAAAPEPARRIYSKGLALQLSNPKTLIFFTAIVPQFVTPGSAMPIPTQMAILGATSIIPEFFILLAYGALAAKASTWARNPRFSAWPDRIAGLLLIAVALSLALLNRD